MELDLKNVKVKYTVREVVLVLTFLGGLVGSYINTAINYQYVQRQLMQVRQDLADCNARLALKR